MGFEPIVKMKIQLSEVQESFIRDFKDAETRRKMFNAAWPRAVRSVPNLFWKISLFLMLMGFALTLVDSQTWAYAVRVACLTAFSAGGLVSIVGLGTMFFQGLEFNATGGASSLMDYLPQAYKSFKDGETYLGKVAKDSRFDDVLRIAARVEAWNANVPGMNAAIRRAELGQVPKEAVERAHAVWCREFEEVKKDVEFLNTIMGSGVPGQITGDFSPDKLLGEYLPKEAVRSDLAGALSYPENLRALSTRVGKNQD